ncbi:hypothetical protein PTI98_000051 [Pleurotus ostreatus]|nr:hypothetical protein PTI98_000051 [Pleurotus ostreatus]
MSSLPLTDPSLRLPLVLSPQNAVKVVTTFTICWIVKTAIEKAIAVRRTLKSVGDCPGGAITWLHPFRSGAPVLAPFFPLAGRIGDYYAKYTAYAKYGSTVVSSALFSNARPTFWVSDAVALKTISNNRNTFRRDLEGYNVVSVYGPNMVATEGTDWKRHRAVAKPAFNDANNILVWHHSTRVVYDWFSQLDAHNPGNKEFEVDLLKDATEAPLLILSSAAFGRHNSWTDDTALENSKAHHIPFRPAVKSAVENLVPKILTPDWMFTLFNLIPVPKVSPVLKETRESFVALRLHMLDLISNARDWVSGGNAASLDAALLQNLVQANMAQEDDAAVRRKLTDDEMLSDIFMFLLAGHETSAHSLCFTLILLALYPEAQQKVCEEVNRLWPGEAPNADTVNASEYKDYMAKLTYTTAVFQESLRLFPPVPRVASPVSVDTQITGRTFTQNAQGKVSGVQEFTATLPAGSLAVIDIIGLHYNPIHWGDDADEFNPERFIDTDTHRWPRDAYLAFSAGPRSCMGERFAMTESVCFLANVIKRYEVGVPFALRSKPFAEQKKLLTQWIARMTLLPTNAFVTFRRRV